MYIARDQARDRLSNLHTYPRQQMLGKNRSSSCMFISVASAGIKCVCFLYDMVDL